MIGDIKKLSIEEAKLRARIAFDYEVDESRILFFCLRSTEDPDSRVELIRLVVPELLQQDLLQYYHTSLEGGHQVSAEYTNESGPISTGEDSIGVSIFMWENVLISRREKVNLSCAANLRGISKPPIRFK